VQHIPHGRAKSATSFMEAYVSLADAKTGEALRTKVLWRAPMPSHSLS